MLTGSFSTARTLLPKAVDQSIHNRDPNFLPLKRVHKPTKWFSPDPSDADYSVDEKEMEVKVAEKRKQKSHRKRMPAKKVIESEALSPPMYFDGEVSDRSEDSWTFLDSGLEK